MAFPRNKHGHYLEDLSLGMRSSLQKKFTQEDVIQFAELTGDNNPIHLDEEFASASRFKERIVHGALTSALISTILGTQLPGPGAIFLSQKFKYKAPVMVGSLITAQVEITDIDSESKRVKLKATCHAGDTLVLEGDVLVMVNRKP